jgi:spermidine/putrescine transport system ATP-binding protein
LNAANTAAAPLELRGLNKSFGGKAVIHDLNLVIERGEFLTILGPSGCGKTTVLRCIGGLEQPDRGQIFLHGIDFTSHSSERRPVNTVFQSYALFPHMTVFDNVAFGLRMQKLPKPEIEQRVRDALATVRLADFESRKPHQLSGGQQQRVAIARAIVNRPQILLLDECLSALDYKLRQQMQNELKQLQRKLGIPFIYVTHDQEEALSMSDRILVMRDGFVEQLGTPREIYEAPSSLFVAQFIGETNIFPARVETANGIQPNDAQQNAARKNGATPIEVSFEGQRWQVLSARKHNVGETVHVCLRPEDLRVESWKEAKASGTLSGVVIERNYKGATLETVIKLDSGREILASEFFDEDDPDFDYRLNERVLVRWVSGWETVLCDKQPG